MHHTEFTDSTNKIPFDTSYGAQSGIGVIDGDADDAATYYSGYRWFKGIDPAKNAATSEVNDPAKLKCHTCNIVRELKWDSGQFKLVDPAAPGTNKNGENLWAICNTKLKQRSCEYSAGTCFIEERRTWGYITQVRAGCKQAQACYMQKYQNFLVKAGRQCWPGDNTGMDDFVARRPYDLYADQWISNIVRGGITDKGTGSSSFKYGGAFGGAPFDNTMVDANGMTSHGFYITGGAQGTGGTANTQLRNKYTPLAYENGAKETSKCYQCCNTEHNCNFQWQPITEADWNYAYVHRYNPSGASFVTANSGASKGIEKQPRNNDDGIRTA